MEQFTRLSDEDRALLTTSYRKSTANSARARPSGRETTRPKTTSSSPVWRVGINCWRMAADLRPVAAIDQRLLDTPVADREIAGLDRAIEIGPAIDRRQTPAELLNIWLSLQRATCCIAPIFRCRNSHWRKSWWRALDVTCWRASHGLGFTSSGPLSKLPANAIVVDRRVAVARYPKRRASCACVGLP
jgi:hypothetical protein